MAHINPCLHGEYEVLIIQIEHPNLYYLSVSSIWRDFFMMLQYFQTLVYYVIYHVLYAIFVEFLKDIWEQHYYCGHFERFL